MWFGHKRVKLTICERLKRVPKKGMWWGRALHPPTFCFSLCSTGSFFCTPWPWLYHPAAACEMLGLMCQHLCLGLGVQGTASPTLAYEQQCFVLSQPLPQKPGTAYTALVGVDVCFCCPSTRCSCTRLSDLSLQLEPNLISMFRLV